MKHSSNTSLTRILYLQKSAEGKGKLHKMRDRLHIFCLKIKIPGVSPIFKTEFLPLKILWVGLIMTSALFGIANIANTTRDFYNFRAVTKVETVTVKNFVLPAITICANCNLIKKSHYLNESLVTENDTRSDRGAHTYMTDRSIKSFIEKITLFYPDRNNENGAKNDQFLPINISQLEYFKIEDVLDSKNCFRLNGALSNQQPITVNKTSDRLIIDIRSNFTEKISAQEKWVYSLEKGLDVYIKDQHLNSFYSFDPISFTIVGKFGNSYDIKVEKSTIESKLGEPFNPCRRSDMGQPYHQMNCIEGCIYRNIREQNNCTLKNSLFAVDGLASCEGSFWTFEAAFSKECEKECPLGCDSTKYDMNYLYKPHEHDSAEFHFSVSDFSSLLITQCPNMNEFNLISNIGGSLGLFMGISFLNSIEVFDLIIDLMTIIFTH